jgi:hypothetical protein
MKISKEIIHNLGESKRNKVASLVPNLMSMLKITMMKMRVKVGIHQLREIFKTLFKLKEKVLKRQD